MRIRNLTATGDWTFGAGANNFLTGQAAIEENIKTRVLSWKGNCFFALNDGVDWKSRLDVGQQANLQQEVMAMILSSYGVIGITSFALNYNHVSRAIAITYTVQTIYSSYFQAVINLTAGTNNA